MNERELLAVQRGLVPSRVCTKYTGYHTSSLTRAVAAGRLRGERIGQRLLFIEWADFIRYVGPGLASSLPETATAAMERE